MNLWSMSVSGGIFILAIVAVRSLLQNRLPGKVFQALWFAVFLRLMIPFSIPCPCSVYTLAEKLAMECSIDGMPWNHADNIAVFDEMSGNKASGEAVSANAANDADLDLRTVWLPIYLGGVFLCILYYVSVYVRCHREFATSLPIEDLKVQEWAWELSLRRKVSVRQWEGVETPLAYGIIHPVILLPKSLVKADREQLRFVLLHEYMHIRHFDTVKKIFLILSCCIHWFNPLVWAMCILANRDIEIACDENVVRYLGGESRADYAYALIDLEEQKGARFSFGNSFCRNAMEERVVAIMKEKKKSMALGVLSGVLTAGMIMVFTTSAFVFGKTVAVAEDIAEAAGPVDGVYAVEEGDSSYEYEENTAKMLNGAEEAYEEAADIEYDMSDMSDATAIAYGMSSDIAYAAEDNETYEGSSTPDVPAEYASYGITANHKTGTWMYQGKEVAVFHDKNYLLTNGSCGKNAVYLEVCRDKNGDIEEIKELGKREMQALLRPTGLELQ